MPRYGKQKPRIDIFQDGFIDLAERGLELIRHYGIELLPWQELVLRRWLATDKNDCWANNNCGLVVPRQNGKSELLIARIIIGMIFRGEHIVFTAQSVETANTIKRRVFRFFFEAESEIRDLLTSEFDKEPRSFDYVEIRNGGRCAFRTRTRSGGLGTTNDVIIIDEAQEYTDAQQEALRPTISAGHLGNSQTIMAGTPPTAGTAGTVFERTRRNILAGKGGSWCWQEWSVENITTNDDKDAWYATNPSLGYFVQERAIEDEAVDMAQDSFNRMRLGWFAGVDSARLITDEEWNKLAVEKVVLPDEPELVYSVKFAPDRSASTLAVGAWVGDKVHLEVINRRPMSDGIGWISAWLLPRYKKCNKIVIDGAAGAQLLVEELVRSDRKTSKYILTPNVREAGAAYAGFMQAIEDGTITHFNQPLLNSAIRTTKRRDIGRDGMFGFAPMNPLIQTDAVDAIAFALYGSIRFRGSTKKNTTQRVMFF